MDEIGMGGHATYTEPGDQDDELVLGLVRGAHIVSAYDKLTNLD